MLNEIWNLIQSNPYVAPAIMAVMSGTISGMVVYAARDVPVKIWQFIKSQITTNLVLNTGDYAEDTAYEVAERTLEAHRIKWARRYWKVMTQWLRGNKGLKCSVAGGFGTDVYYYCGKIIWATREERPSIHGGDSGKIHHRLTLTWLGRGIEVGNALVAALNAELLKTDEDDSSRTPLIDVDSHGNTRDLSTVLRVTLDDIALDPHVKEMVTGAIRDFKQNMEFCQANKLSHKLIVLLYGPAGTGKTLLTRAIAGEFNHSIMDGSKSSIKVLREFMHSHRGKNTVITLEDVDTLGVLKDRQIETPSSEKTSSDGIGDVLMGELLGDYLNLLDGVAPLEGNVVVLTTNDINAIDPAFYRDGRVNLMLEVGALPAESIQEHLESIYGHLPELEGKWVSFNGALLYTIKTRAAADRNKVVQAMESIYEYAKWNNKTVLLNEVTLDYHGNCIAKRSNNNKCQEKENTSVISISAGIG